MLILTSPDIVEQGIIPTKYTMDNPNQVGVSPPLSWTNVPPGTKSFALALVDPDVPLEEVWFPYKDALKVGMWPGDLCVHWMVYDIPASAKGMEEGKIAAGAKELTNGMGAPGYLGMGPPPGHKAHKYVFTLYALSVDKLGLSPEANYVDFTNAMKGKILAAASIAGYFGH
jgi:Raf kinase inhibitor-like YbhB/YbcL family protein